MQTIVCRLSVYVTDIRPGQVQHESLQISFGIVVRQFRERAGVSQEELAHRAQLHRTYVSLLERGQRTPSLGVVFALSEALEVSPAALVQAVETRAKEQA